MQEDTFGPVSSAFKAATTSALRFAKGKLGAEKSDILDAVAMARALIVILGDGTRTGKADDIQTTVKNLVSLQKHSSPEEAEIFAAVLYQMQQGSLSFGLHCSSFCITKSFFNLKRAGNDIQIICAVDCDPFRPVVLICKLQGSTALVSFTQ